MARQPNVVLVTGGFDPLHAGHIELIRKAGELGEILVVGVNSDAWLERKKGRAFMKYEDRSILVSELKGVTDVITFDDTDGSAKDAIRQVRKTYPNNKIIFANGGDRTRDNIPEMDYPDKNIEFVFGIGGTDKINSSSWILAEWKNPKTMRNWGYYRVLHEIGQQVKLKELTVNPGNKLSMQRHFHREEYWFVAEGVATLYTLDNAGKETHVGDFGLFQSLNIECEEWHQLRNEQDFPLKIIEIQFGDKCIEEDIVRKTNR